MNILNQIHDEARAFYDTCKKLLNEEINDKDNAALIIMSVTYSNYLEATENLQLEGFILEIEHKGMTVKKPSPWVKIQLDSQIQLLKQFAEFGLTPKSRMKWALEDDEESNPLLLYLKRLTQKEECKND